MVNIHCHRIESFSRVPKIVFIINSLIFLTVAADSPSPATGLANVDERVTRHNVAYKLIFADENVSTFRDNNIAVYTVDVILIECFQNNKIFFAFYFIFIFFRIFFKYLLKKIVNNTVLRRS